MKLIAILLMIVGIVGLFMGSMMVGDIGIAAIIGASGALLSGIGFYKISNQLKSTERN